MNNAAPITLATLHQASLQEIFDQSAWHLLAQGQKSLASLPRRPGLACAYRGNNGMKCAVGVFIADDEYSPAMEGKAAVDLCRAFAKDAGNLRVRLLADLQSIHDAYKPRQWRRQLRNIARVNALSFDGAQA